MLYLVVCVWVHGCCLHAQLRLRRLNNHVVHIVSPRRCGPRLRTVVLGHVLFGPGNRGRSRNKDIMKLE